MFAERSQTWREDHEVRIEPRVVETRCTTDLQGLGPPPDLVHRMRPPSSTAVSHRPTASLSHRRMRLLSVANFPDPLPELDRIIRKMLRKNPRDRHQHMRDLLAELRAISQGGLNARKRGGGAAAVLTVIV